MWCIRTPLISPWSMASWWKKPCNFPVDFVYYRDKRYFELILIQSIKKSVFQQTLEDVTPPVGWMWFFLIRFDLSAMSVNPSVRQSLSHTARFTKNTFNFSVRFSADFPLLFTLYINKNKLSNISRPINYQTFNLTFWGWSNNRQLISIFIKQIKIFSILFLLKMYLYQYLI